LLLAGLVLGWWAWMHLRAAPDPVGGLTAAADLTLPQTHTLGSFRVYVADEGEGLAVTVRHQAEPERVLWATLPGQAFVAAAVGQETVTMSRGHFQVRDTILAQLPDQRLERLEESRDALAFHGEVRSQDGEERADYRLSFTLAGEDRLRFELVFAHPDINRSYLRYLSSVDERFFGFGLQLSHLDMKGRRLPIFIGEPGVGRGLQPLTWAADFTAGAGGAWHSSYAAVPHYLTSKLRSLFLETSEYSVFDLRHDEQVIVEVFSAMMKGQILYGDSPTSLIERYTDYAGRMSRLPEWLHQGAIIGLQGGSARVREKLSWLKAHGVPLAGAWLQDWVGQRQTGFGDRLWWNWQLDRTRYPDWEDLIAELEAEGIRVLAYVNPYLADDIHDHSHERNLFAEAKAAGYLVHNPEGEVYRLYQGEFYAAPVDLTHPEAWDWLKGIIRENLLESGVFGWMADFAEGLPYDAVLYSGEDAAGFHNRYAEAWAALNREVIEEAGLLGEALAFHRSGYTRSPSWVTLFWLGDQLVSWDRFDGIKTVIIGLLSSGISGFSLTHSDTGGYTAITDFPFNYRRSPELFKRWAELSAFTPVLRTHEGNRPADNHQLYDAPETMRHFAKMARLYVAWADYRRTLVEEAAESGLPVVRPLFLHYPDDENVLDLTEQFMVGPDLIVAPVLDPGKDAVSLYLPAGRWLHLWSEEAYGDEAQGGWVRVPAPIGEPAVFYREGAEVGEMLARERAR
jgi:sulfoquinovosidase